MNICKKFKIKEVYQGRILKGSDILESFVEICKKNNIKSGTITAIGAVSKACLGYYDQNNQKYIML